MDVWQVRVFKSTNFNANLDGARIANQVRTNLRRVGGVARENSNNIAPYDTGNLRKSSRVLQTIDKVTIEWFAKYADKVFKVNKKNPNTTRWTERDYEKNSEKYLEESNKGVIK